MQSPDQSVAKLEKKKEILFNWLCLWVLFEGAAR
jgi:hypothetical protein